LRRHKAEAKSIGTNLSARDRGGHGGQPAIKRNKFARRII